MALNALVDVFLKKNVALKGLNVDLLELLPHSYNIVYIFSIVVLNVKDQLLSR